MPPTPPLNEPRSASGHEVPSGVAVRVEGTGLHSGAPCVVTLRAVPGPVRLRCGAHEATLGELSVASTARATTVEACGGALRVGTVEHLFAALAGLGVHEGLALDVDGPEMPMLDGGASAWCEAIARLGPPASPPRLRVTRFATYDAGPSLYELAPAGGVHV
ncbi:MAG: UDP-3-O-acyl-N-acetylglucosamine deacetylase, partial [Polyangiaceae bacterium]